MAEYFSNTDRGYRLRLVANHAAPNIPANTTDLHIIVYLQSGGYSFSGYNCTVRVNVNAVQFPDSTVNRSIGLNSEIEVYRQVIPIKHNPDGTKQIYIQVSLTGSGGWSPGTLALQPLYTFPRIPRASSVTGATANIGGTMPITISAHDPSFTHTLTVGFGSHNATIATGVKGSFNWNIDEEVGTAIPGHTTGQGTLWCYTYQNGSLIGQSPYIFTLNIPNTFTPTFSGVTILERNSTVTSVAGAGNYVQQLSDLAISFTNATARAGATIVSYTADLVGQPNVVNSNGGALGPIRASGTLTLKCSVTDSRGFTSTVINKSITVIPYAPPNLKFTLSRVTSNKDQLNVNREGGVSPIRVNGVQKNRMTVTFYVAPLKTKVFTPASGSANVASTTLLHTLVKGKAIGTLPGPYSQNSSYIVRGVVQDSFDQNRYEDTIISESVVYAYRKDGSFGVGKVPELGGPGSIDIAGDAFASGSRLGLYGRQPISNMDEALTAGVYYFRNTTTGQPNNAQSYGTLEVIVSNAPTLSVGGTWCWQIYRTTNGRTWERIKLGLEPFSAWKVVGLDQIYPLGAIFESTQNIHPTLLMGGNWERFGNGRVLVGVDENDIEFNASNKTGGSKLLAGLKRIAATFGLSITNSYAGRVVIGATANTASSETDLPVSNVQPYITVYRWRRIA